MERGGIILNMDALSIGYTRHARRQEVFSGITATARRGELIALMGRNGTGKSTLLRCLTRMLPPLEGSIILEEKILSAYTRRALAKKVAWVSTDPVQVQHLKVIELVRMGRYPWTGWTGSYSREDRDAVWKAMEAVGIMGLAQRDIQEISDGERQRAMIARTLAQDTDFIVLDEPTAYLDLVNRYEIIHLLLRLSHVEDKCVIFSTHDWQMAMAEADRIWLMDEQGWFDGAPEDLGLQKRFEQLIASESMRYDPRTGQVKLKRSGSHRVQLEGEGETLFWTRKALERTGCRITTGQADWFIRIIEEGGRTGWQMESGSRSLRVSSLYDLVRNLGRSAG